jgi:hypothetical protein
LRQNLSTLGLDVSEETAFEVVETIDIDHNGEIDEHEFIAWMEDNVSRLKMALVVTRIMMGLGQVMLKQPEALKEEFPGPQVGFHALASVTLVRKTSSLPRS